MSRENVEVVRALWAGFKPAADEYHGHEGVRQ
jgi:hypothetical protein